MIDGGRGRIEDAGRTDRAAADAARAGGEIIARRGYPLPGPFAWAAAVIGAVPLAGAASMGFFSRYIADDFCTAGTLRRLGFWESQSNWYLNWSGRYSFTFVATSLNLVGPGITPWLSLAVLVLWLGAGVYLFRAWISQDERSTSGGIAFALSALLLFFTVEGAPNLYQSLYWQTGMLTYTLPLALGTFYLGWLLRRSREGSGTRPVPVILGACAIFAFLMGGFSETFVGLQTGAMALWMAGILVLPGRSRRGESLWLSVAGLLGSLLALLVVAMAPGNAVRQSALPEQAQLAQIVERSWKDMYIFLARVGRDHTIGVFLALSLPAAWAFFAGAQRGEFSREERNRSLMFLIGLPFVTAALVLVTILPYEYAVSSYPDERVLITTQFVLGLGLLTWGLVFGELAARVSHRRIGSVGRVISTAGGLLLLAVFLATAVQTFRALREPLPAAWAYAEAWDRRDRDLRLAAADDVETIAAASLRHMGGLAELGRDPSEWINRCIAWTYGLDQVVAK